LTQLLDSSKVFTAHVDAWQTHGRLFEPFGGGTAELAGWRLMASGLPYPYLNAACVTDPAVADISAAQAWYRDRGLPWGTVVRSGSAWPHGRLLLTQRLMALLPARSATAAPSGLILRSAGGDDLETVVAVDNGAFGSGAGAARAWLGPLCRFDDVEVVLAEIEGAAVATGYATTCDGYAGPSLYVGGIGVLPAARRRGVASALLRWLLDRGFDRGARLAHLQTDSDGAARVYARLGFAEFNGIDIYTGP
jgi:GNAT superfamily N-acetyltransferase